MEIKEKHSLQKGDLYTYEDEGDYLYIVIDDPEIRSHVRFKFSVLMRSGGACVIELMIRAHTRIPLLRIDK